MRTVVRKYQSIHILVVLSICVTVQPLVAQQAQSNNQSRQPNYAGIQPPLPPTLAPGQKMVILSRYNLYDAVRVNAVMVDGKTAISRQPFEASPNWIADTNLILRNDSSKPLVNVLIQVSFPEYPGISSEFDAGQSPEAARYTRSGILLPPSEKTAAISIPPGQTISISMNGFIEQFTHALQDRGVTPRDTHIIQIEVVMAYFADTTRWQHGATSPYTKPDFTNHGRWVSIEPEEFGPVSNGR